MTVVIWNPDAGKKVRGPAPGTTEAKLREILDNHGVTAQIIATKSEDDARKAVRDAVAAGHEIIVAAGGDGTIGLVGRELIGKTDVALGILPLGSVMNVPRMLGLPRDLEQAAAAIVAGGTRLIDVGEANGVTFFEAASVGMHAAIFSAAQRIEDGDLGSPLRAVRIAFRYQPSRMTVEMDDETVNTRALMVAVSNGPYMGLAMTVAPEARLDDGRFDVRVFSRFSKFELVRHLVSIAFGRRRYEPRATTYRSAKVRITSARPLPCRADANDLGTTPIECVCQHAALRVIVGPEFSAGQAPTGSEGLGEKAAGA